MSRVPDLKVPQAGPPAARAGLSGFVFVLLLIVLVVQILSLFVSPGRKDDALGSFAAGLWPPAEQLKEVAVDLEDKNFPAEAARVWEQYLDTASLSAFEVGNVRYRIGKAWQASGDYERAFLEYAVSEKLLGDSAPELLQEIKLRRMECLRRRGQIADLAREMAEGASLDGAEGELEGQQVVATVGGDKITIAAFDRLLTHQIEMAVKSRLGLTPEQEQAFRKRFHEQFADPQMRARELQQIIGTRVLAGEARKRKIHQSEEFLSRLISLADGILSQTLLYEEVNKRATVTPADVERYYAANQDNYAEPPSTFIGHILCRDEAHARDIIKRINGGGSFEQIAKAESLDEGTRSKLGIVAAPVPDTGEYVPVFGANKELHDLIRGAEAGKILGGPYESDRGWHVVKVVSHQERVERPLAEIEDEVRNDTIAARRREVTEQYVTELFDRYDVQLYPEAFAREPVASEAGP